MEKEYVNTFRKMPIWGTYGKNGDQPLKFVCFEEMDTEHIEAILKTQKHISDETREVFKMELKYRKSVK